MSVDPLKIAEKAGQMQGKCRANAWQMQGKCRANAWQMQGKCICMANA
jgi:hypothetical protein